MQNYQNYQGDVSIIKIDLETLKEKLGLKDLNWNKSKSKIVAHGENGHNHTVCAPAKEIEYIETENGFIMNFLEDGVKIKHQEHKVQTFTKGIYWVGRQFEYNALEKYRLVRD